VYPTPQDDQDSLPELLPYLVELSSCLHQCRFPAFWKLFCSDKLDWLRDNYTVECVGFEDSVREVVIRAVRAAFQKIGKERLGGYLDLEGVTHVVVCWPLFLQMIPSLFRRSFGTVHYPAGLDGG
jgi:translation initiation factor 3 subunit K